MDTEELLKLAQSGAQEVGEYEASVTRKGIAYAMMISIVMCIAMCVIEGLVFKKIDCGKVAIIFVMAAVTDIYESKIMKNTKMKIRGIIYMIVAIFWLFLYVGALFV